MKNRLTVEVVSNTPHLPLMNSYNELTSRLDRFDPTARALVLFMLGKIEHAHAKIGCQEPQEIAARECLAFLASWEGAQ